MSSPSAGSGMCGRLAGAVSGDSFRTVVLSSSEAWHGFCVKSGYSMERFLTIRTLRVDRSYVYLRVPIDPARSPMTRDLLLPAHPVRFSASLGDMSLGLNAKLHL